MLPLIQENVAPKTHETKTKLNSKPDHRDILICNAGKISRSKVLGCAHLFLPLPEKSVEKRQERKSREGRGERRRGGRKRREDSLLVPQNTY